MMKPSQASAAMKHRVSESMAFRQTSTAQPVREVPAAGAGESSKATGGGLIQQVARRGALAEYSHSWVLTADTADSVIQVKHFLGRTPTRFSVTGGVPVEVVKMDETTVSFKIPQGKSGQKGSFVLS